MAETEIPDTAEVWLALGSGLSWCVVNRVLHGLRNWFRMVANWIVAMRRREKEVSDQGIIGELLSSAQVCRLAMVDGAEPYVVPLNYGYEDGVIYVHSARAGRKIEILRKNPRVCFEIETPSEVIRREVACDWSTKARSIVGYGHVEFVEDPADKRHGLDVIMAHHGQKGPNHFEDRRVNAVEILRIRIESMACKQLGVWDLTSL